MDERFGALMILALLGVGVAAVFLFPSLTTKAATDIAGIGIHQTVGSSRTCAVETVVSKSFSPLPVTAPAWAPNAFYTETDVIKQVSYPNSSCSGTPTSTTTFTSIAYPVTPAMVYDACATGGPSGNVPGFSTCTAYPQNVIQTYLTMYPSIMSGQFSVVSLSVVASVSPSSLITWEAVGG
jgi:hypothetical protein